jgi:hypothetical protein
MKTISLRRTAPVSRTGSRVAHGGRARRAQPSLRPVDTSGRPVSRWQVDSDGRLICVWS